MKRELEFLEADRAKLSRELADLRDGTDARHTLQEEYQAQKTKQPKMGTYKMVKQKKIVKKKTIQMQLGLFKKRSPTLFDIAVGDNLFNPFGALPTKLI